MCEKCGSPGEMNNEQIASALKRWIEMTICLQSTLHLMGSKQYRASGMAEKLAEMPDGTEYHTGTGLIIEESFKRAGLTYNVSITVAHDAHDETSSISATIESDGEQHMTTLRKALEELNTEGAKMRQELIRFGQVIKDMPRDEWPEEDMLRFLEHNESKDDDSDG